MPVLGLAAHYHGAAPIFPLFLLLLYFLPSIVAGLRQKSNFLAIFLLNFFLGWTLIGWVISLVWAVKNDFVDIPERSDHSTFPNQVQGRFCYNCRRHTQQGSRFCAHCGLTL